MQLRELIRECQIKAVKGSLDVEVTSLISDSRKAGPGCLFVALTGTVSDGHTYIPQVIDAGAAVIVAEREVELLGDRQVTYVLVENSRMALALLSAAWFGHPAKELTLIGITGTKGKTTTSAMVTKILEEAGKKVGLIGTNGAFVAGKRYPTKNTTPESYELQMLFREMADKGCTHVVMEVSSQGIMMHRVGGILFDYGIFTNISPDHIGPGEHKDFEEYLSVKSRLLQCTKVCLVNRDDSHYEQIVKDGTCQLETFGIQQQADWMPERIDYLTKQGFMGIGFSLRGRKDFYAEVSIPGLFNVYNALAATGLALTMGIEKEAIQRALAEISVDGRMEIVYASEKLVALVDYAHNAVSMESLLETLRAYHPKRLICVFGCGGNRSKLRRYEMGEIGGKLADLSIITADNSRWEKVEDIIADIRIGMDKTEGKFMEIPDRREAIRYCIANAEEGDMIAVIGKGHEDYQEICGVRTHFLDREELTKALAEYGYLNNEGGCAEWNN